jgi:hypothetical protein
VKKLLFILLVFAAPFVIAQKLKQEDLNVYVTHTHSLFASQVSGFDQVDLRNSRAVHIAPDGRKGEWQALKRGKGKTEYVSRYGVFEGATEVDFGWRYWLDAQRMVVDYGWVWSGGSSNQSDIVQVLEWRDGRVWITQQIEADTYGGGTIAGAWFDQNAKRLTVKAVELGSPNGRCCPTHINVVVFRWDGGKFRQERARQVPMPPDKFDRKNLPTAGRDTGPSWASH